MAVIVFYDTTELDRQQLSDGLSATDHHWEFVNDIITTDNLNPEAEIVSVFVSSKVTREMIEAMPKLTLIACRSTGFNNIDLEAAQERNITVVTVPTYGDTTVAEYAFTMLLALTRKLQSVLAIENETFTASDLTGHDLAGKTFGVIGSGHIGQKALKIAHGFSMRTLAYDPFPNEKVAAELGFSYVSLEELLAQSDVVSLHVPYNNNTHHILNSEHLHAMKPSAILVNTARGALVDTRALIEVLDSGHLSGAVLDVMEGENLLNFDDEIELLLSGNMTTDTLTHSVEISVLKKMPNVIVSPHNAYNTVEAIGRINQTTVQNIVDFYNGNTPNAVPGKGKKDTKPTGKLILIRHTESEWNACGVWTGHTDIGLTEKGKQDCVPLGAALKDLGVKLDVACYTPLSRTKETLDGVCTALGDETVEKVCEDAFIERNYGDFTGKNKWEVKDAVGEEAFNRIRRGWNVEVPNGETLKMVYERVVPVYEERILPMLREGKNVLIVAHGNSLRALIKHVESISDEDVENLEMPICQIFIYEIDPETGLKKSVEVVSTNPDAEAERKGKY